MIRNTITACLLLLSVSTLLAQPVITSAVHQPLPGDNITRSLMSVPGFTPGPSGAGVTFNFQGASPNGTVEQGVFVSASGSAPWSYNLRADFSNSGIGYKEYYRSSPDSLAYSGFDRYIPDVTPVERHNPSVKFPFPFTYGGSFHDTYSGQHANVFGPIPFTGTVDVAADAWGDLILGMDTLPNVLRIHTLDTLRETLFGTPIMVAQECYEYFSDTAKFPVLSACTDPQNGGAYSFYSALRTFVVGISSDLESSILLYPNPAVDELVVECRIPMHMVLLDLHGREVGTQELGAGKNAVAIRHLPTGIYTARLESEHGSTVRMVQKVK